MSEPIINQPITNKPIVGILEWFRPGEHERVERVLSDLKRLGVRHLRTGVSWADWLTPAGKDWYDWLLPRLAGDVELLPCFVYTPPSLGITAKSSAPPRNPKWYADFLDLVITQHGDCFQWVELWNEPNNLREWDVTLDPEWLLFSEMVGGAAFWAHQRGKKTVLGGTSPLDPHWIRLMCERGVIAHLDAVGVHGFPATFEFHWEGWNPQIARVRAVLDRHASPAEIWVTETGYSTWRHDERRQLSAFQDAARSSADRVYWYAAQDLSASLPTVDGFHSDEREYHFGLRREDGGEKLLSRLWAGGGLSAVGQTDWLGSGVHQETGEGAERPTLITGGAGFVGTNLADRLLRDGQPVLLYDNLSRPGVEKNARWLREQHGERVQIEVADVRDPHALGRAVSRAAQVFHFAAQVAVTSSLTNPVYDFEVNARGTLNLLEALRAQSAPPPLIFTSTNKVYGDLEDVPLRCTASRYEPEDPALRAGGMAESRPLDFHSPYGCSKGAADQYVLDYARSFGLRAAVFRMSCIYGPHQFGTEDQGWVAHFLIQTLQGKPITLYGDGRQVRDVLFAEDLVQAFLRAMERMDTLTGQAFNIGGGPENTTSLLDLLALIGELHGHAPELRFEDWRVGDQRYYVSDTRRFQAAAGWSPQVDVCRGVERLYAWLCESQGAARAEASQ